MTLVAFLALASCPMVYILYFKGEALRKKSPYARQHFYEYGVSLSLQLCLYLRMIRSTYSKGH